MKKPLQYSVYWKNVHYKNQLYAFLQFHGEIVSLFYSQCFLFDKVLFIYSF